ncbi:response regulator [Mucilaginibacter sp.]|uniref:response regulator n=1 Tax=Mucilaginibacter sp. TaxID=1882438 RepID=UPI003D14A5C2
MKKISCILLIDDNKADNAFHQIKIKKAQVCEKVSIATSGTQALDYLAKAVLQNEAFPKPDLIFLDINLPGMDGFDFLDEFHKLNDELKSKTKVIMLTTSLNPDDQTRALNYKEVKSFLNKPLTVELIQDTVASYF